MPRARGNCAGDYTQRQRGDADPFTPLGKLPLHAARLGFSIEGGMRAVIARHGLPQILNLAPGSFESVEAAREKPDSCAFLGGRARGRAPNSC